jgi:hypothetical protein
LSEERKLASRFCEKEKEEKRAPWTMVQMEWTKTRRERKRDGEKTYV